MPPLGLRSPALAIDVFILELIRFNILEHTDLQSQRNRHSLHTAQPTLTATRVLSVSLNLMRREEPHVGQNS